MKREDLKEIISSVIEKMKQDSPEAACGFFWEDDVVVTTLYSVGEEDATTRYSVGEED